MACSASRHSQPNQIASPTRPNRDRNANRKHRSRRSRTQARRRTRPHHPPPATRHERRRDQPATQSREARPAAQGRSMTTNVHKRERPRIAWPPMTGTGRRHSARLPPTADAERRCPTGDPNRPERGGTGPSDPPTATTGVGHGARRVNGREGGSEAMSANGVLPGRPLVRNRTIAVPGPRGGVVNECV